MIDRPRWQELSALLDQALALDEPARGPWLAALRQRDTSLADDVQRMLQPAAGGAGHDATTSGMHTFGKLLGQALAPEEASLVLGQRLGPWELLRKIGEGGMGQVWLARRADGLYEAQAAIKLLRSDLSAAGLGARFARERAVLARLNHPAVARLLDAGIENHQAYLVLEYVDGALLADHVRQHCPTVAQRVRLMQQIGEAVDHAHSQLIVHRDLKPSNVLVTQSGQPKLLDFGIAGLLDDGEPVNTDLTRQTGRGLTLGYAAPEQIMGEAIGTSADVFSMGVMLFELLCGELPFAARNTPRVAAERAVLHDEPKRLAAFLRSNAEAAVDGPGRPSDPARTQGDLEAIVAKALRKNPAERYGSVQALLDDLQNWQEHRPVSARRDDWRHRTQLWFRRNALLAAGLAVVVLSLTAGLATALWQSQKAQAAARQSEQVTRYLTELLASASPERHGGNWPTVLQLLESSRAALPQQFRDEPDTRFALLRVLADTYHELNRFDISMPMNRELVELGSARYGASDKRTLVASFREARAFQVQGLFDKAIATLEPLQATFAQTFGAQSEELRQLLYVLGTSYTRAGRLDDAERLLGEAGKLTDARFPEGSQERLNHLNHLQVLRVGQGRLSEALAVMKLTEPYWANPPLVNKRQVLILRRNTIAVQIRLGLYEGIEERALAVISELDQFMGPANDISTGMRHELARYFTEIGHTGRALEQRQENLRRQQSAKVVHPAVLLPLQVHVLLARAQAHAAEAPALTAEARALLQATLTNRDTMGYGRAEAWINLVRVGLLLDDARLAGEALAPLKADTGLRMDRDVLLASRVAQLEGALARLQGDLPRSRSLLQQRMKVFERPGDKQVLHGWVAALDLAYTEVLMGAPEAAATLDAAAARRPAGVPAGHGLDAAQAYLRARLAAGPGAKDSDAALQEAISTLQRAQGRRGGPPSGAGLGSFGGAII
jgi:eukaryotic-like serine/threonine-protein kinase